jgi:probable HAF family extracellular repeat protein
MVIHGLVRRLSPVTRLALALALILAANGAYADVLYSVTDLGSLVSFDGTPIWNNEPVDFRSNQPVYLGPIRNASGQVVETITINSQTVASVWNPPYGPLDLTRLVGVPGPNSWANAINNLGQVVGAVDQGNGIAHAVLFQGGGYTDLNNVVPPGLGWTLGSAMGIADSGQILAIGSQDANLTPPHDFLLTPLAVPEPASLALWGMAGVVSLACMNRHRRRAG